MIRSPSMKYVWLGVAVIVVIFVVVGVTRLGGGVDDGGLAQLPLDSVDSQDWVKGNPDASAVLIEFGDFQCPACRSYAAVVKEIENEFGDDLAIVYRHFPLRRIHLNAKVSAQAAEAAGMQGKFWEMHDMLFDRQSEWSRGNPTDIFRSYAEQIGIDLQQFEEDLELDELLDEIKRDESSARMAGAQGTPTFVLNGIRIATPGSFDEFRLMIQGAIADKADLLAPVESLENDEEQ